MIISSIPVLYFHSVAPRPDRRWNYSFLTFQLRYFEDLIQYLVNRRFTFLTLDEYFDYRKDVVNRDRRVICLTFDDGYLDNFVFVYPLLQRYKAKATLFVSPEYVQENEQIRPTLLDVWENKRDFTHLETLGYASWKELRLMQDSGVIDIQSHTMTHTKYVVSKELTGFHNPSGDYLYPIANRFPEKKPYYMTDPEFPGLLPWGTPFFKDQLAVIARKVTINKSFQNECVDLLKNTDWSKYSFPDCLSQVESLYRSYIDKECLVDHIESENEYETRVRSELRDSRRIIAGKMGKPVNHLCWPHGKYSELTHRWAREEGYHSTAIVLKPGEGNRFDDRFDRKGIGVVLSNRRLTLVKGIYKLQAYRGIFPYRNLRSIYERIVFGVK